MIFYLLMFYFLFNDIFIFSYLLLISKFAFLLHFLHLLTFLPFFCLELSHVLHLHISIFNKSSPHYHLNPLRKIETRSQSEE